MTPKIYMLCFVLINSIILNLLCVWINTNADCTVPLCTDVLYTGQLLPVQAFSIEIKATWLHTVQSLCVQVCCMQVSC